MAISKNRFTESVPIRVVRRQYRRGVRRFGQDLTASMRTGLLQSRWSNSPAFLIAGVNKAGTTSLQKHLAERHDVGQPLRKEIHYLDDFPSRSMEWYRAQFWGRPDLLWGEATPEYFELPDAPLFFRQAFPEIKVIVCLREPVSRAVSHYYNAVDHGTERRSIEEAFHHELSRIRSGAFALDARSLRGAYLQRSMYGAPLSRWRKHFGDQLLVTKMESRDLVNKVEGHLGLEPTVGATLPRSNSRRYPRPDPTLVEAVRPIFTIDEPEVLEAARWSEGWTIDS